MKKLFKWFKKPKETTSITISKIPPEIVGIGAFEPSNTIELEKELQLRKAKQTGNLYIYKDTDDMKYRKYAGAGVAVSGYSQQLLGVQQLYIHNLKPIT